MATADFIEQRRGSDELKVVDVYRLETFSGSTYECRVIVCPEESGFSAHALRLPGVVRQGATIDDALENIKEAFHAALSVYLEDGEIPWQSVEVDRPKGFVERWILVDVPSNSGSDLQELRDAIGDSDKLVEYEVFRREELDM